MPTHPDLITQGQFVCAVTAYWHCTLPRISGQSSQCTSAQPPPEFPARPSPLHFLILLLTRDLVARPIWPVPISIDSFGHAILDPRNRPTSSTVHCRKSTSRRTVEFPSCAFQTSHLRAYLQHPTLVYPAQGSLLFLLVTYPYQSL